VWDVLTAVERWPTWNPDVKTVSLEGSVAEGSVFRWKAGPGTITSTIQRVDRPRLIAWTGKTFGIDATHVWRLEQGHGKTLVRTEESYEGLVASILRRPLRKALETALTNGLRSLKVEAERRTPA
ncbi:MAG: SRPBCC family protein, partial [Gaiellales bacterium]